MKINASSFARNRNYTLTKHRVGLILVCVVKSYQKILADGIIFNLKDSGSIKKEDYLRNRLVDDYLENELNNISNGRVRFVPNKEVSEEYRSLTDNDLHFDPIDIHIIDYSLINEWPKTTKPYFAIECKRLVNSVSGYVEDIEKMIDRDYKKTRLPFEGQIGFIEHKTWSYNDVKNLINKNLSDNSKIKTVSDLKPYPLLNNFNGCYLSKQLKNDNSNFVIFHLFFDYSKIVKTTN